MGAFHEIVAASPCPACGDVHYVVLQTKFLDPEHEDACALRVGDSKPTPVAAEQLREPIVHDAWLRLHDRAVEPPILILHDLDDLFGCHCGQRFAPVYALDVRTRDEGTQVRLERLELRPFDDRLEDVDYVKAEMLIANAEPSGYDRSMRALAALPPAERLERVRTFIRRPFGHGDHDERARWKVRCEACGRHRSRPIISTFAQLFGAGVKPATRYEADVAGWPDGHRGGHAFFRRPSDRIVVVGPEQRWGCACGAGSTRTVATFAVRPGLCVLEEVTLRAVDGRADVADAHYVYAAAALGHPAEASWIDHGLESFSRRWFR